MRIARHVNRVNIILLFESGRDEIHLWNKYNDVAT